MAYVKDIAHLKSKIKGGEDVDSDSDSEVEEEEVPEEVPAPEPQAAAEPQVENSQQDSMTCKICWVHPIDTVVLRCRHSGCNTSTGVDGMLDKALASEFWGQGSNPAARPTCETGDLRTL